MKRRMITMLLAVMICITGIMSWNVDANAEVESEDIDMSELLTEDALIGYADNQTWGVYFESGNCIINKISSTKIGAGGATNAAKKCTVAVNVIVERKTTSGWARVTSWSQTNENAYTAITSKSLTVGTGYYYRVRCYHYAATDTASSCTNALWMGN